MRDRLASSTPRWVAYEDALQNEQVTLLRRNGVPTMTIVPLPLPPSLFEAELLPRPTYVSMRPSWDPDTSAPYRRLEFIRTTLVDSEGQLIYVERVDG